MNEGLQEVAGGPPKHGIHEGSCTCSDLIENAQKIIHARATLCAVFCAPTVFCIGREGQETLCTACFRAHRSNSFESVIFEFSSRPLGLQGAVFADRVRAGGDSDMVFCEGL